MADDPGVSNGGFVSTVTVKPIKRSFPGRIESLFRAGRTVKLVNSLMHDRRVSVFRKISFGAALISLLVAMIFPELVADSFLSTIMPFISSVIGIPLEAGIDWFTFVMLLPVLMRIFPAPIMQEHYQIIFRKQKPLLKQQVFEAKVVPSSSS
jgi:hypothetical protein